MRIKKSTFIPVLFFLFLGVLILTSCAHAGEVYIPGPEVGLPAPSGGIKEILSNLLKWMLEIFGVVAVIGFVISGIQYITAAGNEDTIDTAKRNMQYSIYGVIAVLASFVIIRAIQYALEARSFF